jgi:hypothetical protein
LELWGYWNRCQSEELEVFDDQVVQAAGKRGVKRPRGFLVIR